MKDYLQELDGNLNRWLTPVVKWLFYLSIGVFAIFIIVAAIAPSAGYFMVKFLGASASTSLFKLQIWQLGTYAFMHGGFGHLFFNLLALYFFGQNLERHWGSRDFLKFSIFVIVGSVLFHLIVALIFGRNNDTIIGISGLVYGVMAACAVHSPNAIVYLQFLFPIKLKFLVMIMAILAFLSSSTSSGGGIAHLTHLGGLVLGYLAAKNPQILDFIPLPAKKYRPTPGRRFR